MSELITPLTGLPPRDPAAALELGERVLKQVTEFPEGHDQSMWERNGMLDENDDVVSCQTTRCVAAWAGIDGLSNPGVAGEAVACLVPAPANGKTYPAGRLVSLAALNDDGMSLEDIARVIEEEL